jgi:RimJ/RimL family protein N-acetyltransferase
LECEQPLQHNITLEKYGARIRPARLEDAAFLVRLRNSPHALGKLGETSQDVSVQEVWLKKYFQRENDYYFIVERIRDDRSVGACSFYNIQDGVAEWGRWVIEPRVPAASISMWLSFHAAFDLLGLKTLRFLVAEDNIRTLSIFKRIDAARIGIDPTPRVIRSRSVRLEELRIRRAEWPRVSAQLEARASRDEKLL